jgi:hypothetical protein
MRCGSGGTPPGALVAGKIVDAGGVAGALQQLLARAEISETRAHIAIGDAVATFKVFKVPASTPDKDIDALTAREFPIDPDRMASRWIEVSRDPDHRVIYAAVWDRTYVKRVMEVAKGAGLETVVVELKSASIARTLAEPSCVVVDMSSDPVEIVLVDDHVPQLWHSFQLSVPIGDDIGPALVAPLRQVLRFYERRHASGFGPESPILFAGEQVIPGQVATYLSARLGHPVRPLLIPHRVPVDVRHGAYLACLGLIMRRSKAV